MKKEKLCYENDHVLSLICFQPSAFKIRGIGGVRDDCTVQRRRRELLRDTRWLRVSQGSTKIHAKTFLECFCSVSIDHHIILSNLGAETWIISRCGWNLVQPATSIPCDLRDFCWGELVKFAPLCEKFAFLLVFHPTGRFPRAFAGHYYLAPVIWLWTAVRVVLFFFLFLIFNFHEEIRAPQPDKAVSLVMVGHPCKPTWSSGMLHSGDSRQRTDWLLLACDDELLFSLVSI